MRVLVDMLRSQTILFTVYLLVAYSSLLRLTAGTFKAGRVAFMPIRHRTIMQDWIGEFAQFLYARSSARAARLSRASCAVPSDS